MRTLGCYAWKPLLLNELRQEYPQAAGIVWLDTAVAFHGPSPQTVRLRNRNANRSASHEKELMATHAQDVATVMKAFSFVGWNRRGLVSV